MTKNRVSVESRKSICKMVKRREISVREAARRNIIPASTISSWMKTYRKDPSFINKNNRRCDFIDLDISEYLDDLAVASANAEIEILQQIPDNEVKYKGVEMDKNIYMFLLIQDLTFASCGRRNIMPFTIDKFEFDILENLRVSLLNNYDESNDDDHDSSGSDSLNSSFSDSTSVSSSESVYFGSVLTSDSYSV